MRRLQTLILLFLASATSATPPPPRATIEEKICRASSVVVATASRFRVVQVKDCPYRGDGRSLSVCEEVEVRLLVSSVVRGAGIQQGDRITFRFGGGLFNVADLRSDLEVGPRYFFLRDPTEGNRPVYRTSYPWFLGVEESAESTAEVNRVLDTCSAPNNSLKRTDQSLRD